MDEELKKIFDQGVADRVKPDEEGELFKQMIEQVVYSAARDGYSYEEICKITDTAKTIFKVK